MNTSLNLLISHEKGHLQSTYGRVIDMTTLNASKKTHEVISAKEFLARYTKDPKSVEGSTFVTPSLGEPGFGYFKVPREAPIYEVTL